MGWNGIQEGLFLLLYSFQLISSEFIVICGFMPATSVLFGADCKAKFIFGKNHRNFIKFNPFPKYLLLAGFGNLGGDMEIWDMDRLKSLGKCNVINIYQQ